MGSFGWRRFFFRIVRKTKSPGCVRVGEETLDSDAILVTRCLAGDDSAFNMLVGRWSRYAGAVALGVTGDHHDAADVVQESFLKAYRKLEDLKDPSSFKSWLRHIVRSTALDRLRRNKTTVALDAKVVQRDDLVLGVGEAHDAFAVDVAVVVDIPDGKDELVLSLEFHGRGSPGLALVGQIESAQINQVRRKEPVDARAPPTGRGPPATRRSPAGRGLATRR